MRSFFANLWQRRGRRLLCIGLIVAALPLLHPFVRQSTFGPKIDGIPWCVWDAEVRREAHAGEPRSWFVQLMEKLGLRDQSLAIDLDSRKLVPVLLHMAEDPDEKVRRVALDRLQRWHKEHEEEITPVFERHLDDGDAHCRLNAAWGVWVTRKDPKAIPVVLPFKEHADPFVRACAIDLLAEAAALDPALFGTLAPLAEDSNPQVRRIAVRSMRHFGKRGMPILQRALTDNGPGVRMMAIFAAADLGKDAEELIPILQTFASDANYRLQAAHALHKIDPKRFPGPAD